MADKKYPLLPRELRERIRELLSKGLNADEIMKQVRKEAQPYIGDDEMQLRNCIRGIKANKTRVSGLSEVQSQHKNIDESVSHISIKPPRNKFSLSDDDLKILLDAYKTWYQGKENEKDYFIKQEKNAQEIRSKLLNKSYIEKIADDQLVQDILAYSKTLEGPAYIRIGETKVKEDMEKIKRNLLYLIDSPDDPFKKAARILEEDYKIPVFAKAFWTPIFQSRYPKLLPNWNNKTENFFKKVGINLKTSKLTVEQKYKTISDAFLYLQKIDPAQSFYNINHLMHYGVVISEGINLIKELGSDIDDSGNEISYWQIAPGRNARFWDDLKNNSIAAVGYSPLNFDLSNKSKNELLNDYKEFHPNDSDKKAQTQVTMLWNFINLRPGDKFITNNGRRLLLGCGIVKGNYDFRPDRSVYKHTIPVHYYKVNEQGIPIPDKYKGKFGRTIMRLKKNEFNELEALFSVSQKSAWIFQANPKYFDIAGAVKSLKLRTWGVKKYKNQIFPGDTVYIWQAGPNAAILGVGEALDKPQELPFPEEEKPFITKEGNFKKIDTRVRVKINKVLATPVLKDKVLSDPILSNLQIIKMPHGAVFPLSEEEHTAIIRLISDGGEKQDYTLSDALKELFMEEDEFLFILNRLKAKKNIIIQGPPGVGKTFIAKRLAYCQMGVKDNSRVQMIQFHQSYSYEDFIQGFRPNDEGKFDLRTGVFYQFCKIAQEDQDNSYFFIIDEINRGNLSKIFGEVLMLIETDKRGQEFAVPLTYSKDGRETFFIPPNLHIIGTMNTADRSLAMVDYALRRRFGFIYLEPKFSSQKFMQFLENANVENHIITKIVDRMTQLNNTIDEDTKNLGSGYQIGHSYFCPDSQEVDFDVEWYRSVIKSEIEPLLEEYWFDDKQKVEKLVKYLLE